MSPINTEIPSEFICPLTLQVFENPLVSRDGMNYERSAIVEWLDLGHDSCPLTRKPLRLSSLIHNMPLKLRIQQWKQETGYQEQPSDEFHTHNNKGFRIQPTGLMIPTDEDNTDEDDNESVVEEDEEEEDSVEEHSEEEAQAPVTIVRRTKNDRTTRAAMDCANNSRRGRNWLPLLRGGRKGTRRGSQ